MGELNLQCDMTCVSGANQFVSSDEESSKTYNRDTMSFTHSNNSTSIQNITVFKLEPEDILFDKQHHKPLVF
jgi:hypothetical protein